MIKLINVSKRFGENVILDNINLHIKQGKILGIIGINGSGKTTLLNLLVGHHKPDNGSVLVKSREVKNIYNVAHFFGFATQDGCFYPKLTVKENLQYFAGLYNLKKHDVDKNFENVSRLLNLYEKRDVLAEKLSAGMQRRLDVACSVIHDPQIILLDEPTANLDPILRKEMSNLIRLLSSQGKTIVLTSHLIEELEGTCHDVAILHNGKIQKRSMRTIRKSRSSLENVFKKFVKA
ncbi:ABC transporter ATP-binding protein [Candidatus Woesearchaeota archaeon]|nr:ABC transporter ATP-binding protein [Candidatus Woesearchaeota archaeon]